MTEGLDPTLGAILPLVGVLIGAMLNVAIAAVADRRRRAAEAKVAARLVAEDLKQMASAAAVVVGTRAWTSLALEERTLSEWREHRVTLARVLEPEEWALLRVAIYRTETAARAAKMRGENAGPVGDEDVPFVKGAHDYAVKAAEMLTEVADVGLHSRRRRQISSEDVSEGLFAEDPFAPATDEDN